MTVGRRAFLASLLAFAPAGCDALLTDPAPAEPEVVVSFAIEAAPGDGLGTAFERVDRVALRFVRPDSAARDTILRLTPRSGTARVKLVLQARERVSALFVHAKLSAPLGALFEGSKVIKIQVGQPTSAEIPLLPIAARVRADRAALSFAPGDTARLGSAVLFATGDTIPGIAGAWTSADGSVVAITPAGLALARALGETRLLVRYRDFADTVLARVRPR